MRLSKGLYMAFFLWPIALGMLLSGSLPFVFGDRPSVRVFSFIFLLAGLGYYPLWAYFLDRSGLAQRVHDFLGLTRNQFTGRYGSSQKEIDEYALRGRDSWRDKKNEGTPTMNVTHVETIKQRALEELSHDVTNLADQTAYQDLSKTYGYHLGRLGMLRDLGGIEDFAHDKLKVVLTEAIIHERNRRND